MFLEDKNNGEAPEKVPEKTEEASLDKKEAQSAVSGIVEDIYVKIMANPAEKMTKEELDSLPFAVSYSEIPVLDIVKARAEDSEKYTHVPEAYRGDSHVKKNANATIKEFSWLEECLRRGTHYLADVEGKYYVIEKK